MTLFTKLERIRFAHCDTAGIVFFPRYFEMLNGLLEDWFDQALGVGFATLHLERDLSTPTVHLECDFSRPSRLGEDVTLSLRLVDLGRSSFGCEFLISHATEQRLRARSVIVFVDRRSGKPIAIPDDLRPKMAALLSKDP
jgi:4-hydroxybenzoyl-CoA thioesterase